MEIKQENQVQPNANEPLNQSSKPKWVREALDWGKSFAVALVIVVFINLFVFKLSTVDGSSMRPTLEHGEWLFVNKIVYLFSDPKPGDIVILKSPENFQSEAKHLVKRIVAQKGDVVEIRDGYLYVNDEKIDEPYTDSLIEDGDFGPYEVKEGYFVMGDNRHRFGSQDSRAFHEVSKDLIEGRADFILWPLSEIGGL